VSDLEIRLARPSEYADVGEVTVAGYRVDGFLDGTDDYEEDLRDAEDRATASELWVAVRDGRVLGTVTFCPPGAGHRELAADDEGEFRVLAVSPNARRMGVARALVEQCFTRARELGLAEMVLCSLPAMTSAHGLYRSLGFSRDPSLDWEPVPGIVLWGFRAPVR